MMTDMFDYFPKWGPYSKKYAGASRVVNHSEIDGARFDVSVAPAVSGFDIRVPNVTLPSAYHPWESDSDYGYYSLRYELEWKDRVYADVSYVRLDEDSTLIRTELVNNSDLIKNCVINYFCSLETPVPSFVKPVLPAKCDFFKATGYSSYTYAVTRPWDEQNADGRRKGVFLDNRFVSGTGLGDRAEKWHMPHKVFEPFGGEKGDSASFDLDIRHDYENAVLAVRYRTSAIQYEQGKMVGVTYIPSEKDAAFLVNGNRLTLTHCDEPQIAFLSLGKLEKGKLHLGFVSLGEGAAEFDFFAVCENEDRNSVGVKTQEIDFVPEIVTAKQQNGFLTKLTYKDVPNEFYLRVFDPDTRFRRIETGALEDCMTARLSNADETFDDVTESFTGAFSRKHSDPGFFHNEITHTIFVPAHDTAVRYAVISSGKREALSFEKYESIYKEKRSHKIRFELNRDGEKYGFSNGLLSAAVMTNVVYPIYKYGDYILHHTPGKRWDCLYTWDSGFIGLGMNEYAPRFAEYILDTYLSDDSNPDYAFLHHGSPVPVQIYQLFEMLQKTNDKQKLLALYSRARLYYLFLRGKVRGSTTAKFKSGLLTTYDYFYSTSGMDDYPAQVAMMKNEKRDTAAPVITTGQVIRFAKILYILADKTGRETDKAEYEADVRTLTDALNKYSWDEDSGYFGYVLHDKDYNPIGIFKTEDGENLNKGLDGIYPIIAGACSEEQKKAILSHLENEKEMLSPYGISAVDQSAGYFKVNGYWNGNIWFPHQWFIWKAMLDNGESDFAFEIARRALDVWKREVEDSYYTFEMVNVVTGCGGWFHNFGGLSTPINLWTKAYYAPGTVNVGFDTYLDKTTWNPDKTEAGIDFTCYGENGNSVLLIVMNDQKNYEILLDGMPADANERTKGCFEVRFSSRKGEKHTLKVTHSI